MSHYARHERASKRPHQARRPRSSGVLTLGLVQRWGEQFPRWMIGLAGREVPVMLAVVPASVVSVLVTSAGVQLSSQPSLFAEISDDIWVYLPQLLWPVWGAALAAATLAYYLRRRGRWSSRISLPRPDRGRQHPALGTEPAARPRR
jgi:hypothetical protein